MNRITYIALCMLASCVASTSLAASASAGEPAWWECARAAKVGRKFTGRYTNRNCSSEATQREIEEGKTNKYEFREWDKAPGEVKAFKGKGGSVDLEERGVGGITCEANSNTGEVLGRKLSVTSWCTSLDVILTTPRVRAKVPKQVKWSRTS